MTALVFVDTNVLLYARDAREPAKQAAAAAWLEEVWRQRTGRTSVQVLSEFYVNATRKRTPGLKPDDAWDDVEALMVWRPLALDETLLGAGRDIQRRYRLSWWDSLIVAAAQLQDCRLLLTEDLQDRAVFGAVTVRSPFTHSVEQAAAEYRPGPAAVARHRGPGRPRSVRGVPASRSRR